MVAVYSGVHQCVELLCSLSMALENIQNRVDPPGWFGVLPLPDLISKDKALAETLFALHQTLNFSLLALLAAHVGAALKHHLIDHDDILARMLPFLNKDKS